MEDTGLAFNVHSSLSPRFAEGTVSSERLLAFMNLPESPHEMELSGAVEDDKHERNRKNQGERQWEIFRLHCPDCKQIQLR
jgi:hypothetical protein